MLNITVETEIDSTHEDSLIIPKVRSISSIKNINNELNQTGLTRPEIELNKKENNTLVEDVNKRESSEYQLIHFSNYSNTLRNTTAQLLKPHLCTFSEFKLMDLHPQQQRLALYLLRKQEIRLMNEGIMKPLSRDEMKIKKKQSSEPKDKTKTGSSFTRFLMKKKSKHSSSGKLFVKKIYIYYISIITLFYFFLLE